MNHASILIQNNFHFQKAKILFPINQTSISNKSDFHNPHFKENIHIARDQSNQLRFDPKTKQKKTPIFYKINIHEIQKV